MRITFEEVIELYTIGNICELTGENYFEKRFDLFRKNY